MLKVKANNNQELTVRWVHADDQSNTLCTIEDHKKQVIAVGKAFRSSKDQFCRSKGRKVSLHKALQSIKDDKIHNRDFRVTIWTAYFDMTKELTK